MSVIIRADSSSDIGLGHVMRDLVLAKQFGDEKVVFACRDLQGNINDRIIEAGFEVAVLESDKIDELTGLVEKYSARMIVIDNYAIGEKEERTIADKTGAKIFVVDDFYNRHYCDVLLNHNVCADAAKYAGLVPDGCELRCGGEYTLLREEFSLAKGNTAKFDGDLTHFMIAMGGTDHRNLNVEIVDVLQSVGGVHAHVVTTTANKHLEKLRAHVEGKNNVTLHVNSTEIAKIMAAVDCAIVSASVTVNEIIYMGTPFVAIQTVDNQQEMAKYLESVGEPVLFEFDKDKLLSFVKEKIGSKK